MDRKATSGLKRQIARIDGEVVEAPLKTKNAYAHPAAGGGHHPAVLKQQRKKSRQQPLGVPLTHRRPNLAGQRPPHAPPGAEAGGAASESGSTTSGTPSPPWPSRTAVDIKTVSGMLGHFSAGFTLDTYAHVTTAAQKEAARTMEKVLTTAL